MGAARVASRALAAGGTALALAAPAVSIADPQNSPPRPPATLLASATPKTVVLNPLTGAAEAVTAGEPQITAPGPQPTAPTLTLATSAISGGTDCRPGDGCYYTPTVDSAYHDRSFYGDPGTFTGYWPRRSAWSSGRYTARACWVGACSQWVGPNSFVTFGGALVTGTSFTIG